MIYIHGSEIRTVCLADMHFSSKYYFDQNSVPALQYAALVEHVRQSNVHYVKNYGDLINSPYLAYLKDVGTQQGTNPINEAEKERLRIQITHKRLRPVANGRFDNISYLIEKFARASGNPHFASRQQIESDLYKIKQLDAEVMAYLVEMMEQSGKDQFLIQGNHDCITLDKTEVSDIFAKANAHKQIIRTAHRDSYHLDLCLHDNNRDPIYVREIMFNADNHNHSIHGLRFVHDDLEWIQDTLAETKGHAIVNMHFPVSYDQNPEKDPYSVTRTYDEADKLRQIFSNAGNVALVMAGHIHKVLHANAGGVNHISVPSFRQIPSYVMSASTNSLKEPAGRFMEVSIDFEKRQARFDRKRIDVKSDGTSRIIKERKAIEDYAPKSPLKISL